MVGKFHATEVVMLVDSGSTHSFISESLAAQWSQWSALPSPIQVRVANGSILLCTHELPKCPVWIDGYCFLLNLRVLPLNCYDIILGMDWLEQHSPMTVDCKKKSLDFLYLGSEIHLQGVQTDLSACTVISLQELVQLEKQDAIWCAMEVDISEQPATIKPLPPEIQALIQQFSGLFEEPSGVPPNRSNSHTIPLIAGAQPFQLRPYRYNPAQKNEIEAQVSKLLQSGMIQESHSPFASPVLFVKKKTGDWRMCVDYRRLNAMTIKNRFPMPIFDEIVDEMYGATWFTTLDMASGYH